MPDCSQRFADRVKSLFQSQKNRAKEKKNKLGRITRKGYVVPFTEKQFGDWLLLKFGAESGCVRCRYCNQPIDAYSCVIDHAVPLNRSGIAGLGNLDAVCDPCNNVKGKMTPEEMDFFLACMRDMAMKFHDGKAVADITHRLQSYSSLKASVNRDRAQKQTAAIKAVVGVMDDENF